ncbi:uncharacterized protein DC041_0001253 [Schistosoma bovis]|uniref:HECT-type E3 ubiquitin transferase n=1 Tax=Schistosoma bovis TaxID=6184 RepID=A0A430PY54_SCHBO|nr:uncharacterized protein DC041_0001253 [Schistosoma bovis]
MVRKKRKQTDSFNSLLQFNETCKPIRQKKNDNFLANISLQLYCGKSNRLAHITIQPNNSGDDFLPVAHTCANLLDLPQYSCKEILAKKLSLAIQQTEGFGLV